MTGDGISHHLANQNTFHSDPQSGVAASAVVTVAANFVETGDSFTGTYNIELMSPDYSAREIHLPRLFTVSLKVVSEPPRLACPNRLTPHSPLSQIFEHGTENFLEGRNGVMYHSSTFSR